MRPHLFASLQFAAMVTAAVVIAGCGPHDYRQSGTPIPGFGNAVQQNSAVMIIDPQPVGAADTAIEMDGRRALIAIERYRSDTVLEPEELSTTEVLPLATGDGTGDGEAQ